MRIREAELHDAAAMARVSVESYRSAHRDQIPEESLMQFTRRGSLNATGHALRELSASAEREEYSYVAENDVESRYVVPGASFKSLIKSYLVAATDSGSDAPARAISGSSWRRYELRLSATARTDDHLSRAAGHHRTGSRWRVRPRDCGGTRLLSLDSAQDDRNLKNSCRPLTTANLTQTFLKPHCPKSHATKQSNWSSIR